MEYVCRVYGIHSRHRHSTRDIGMQLLAVGCLSPYMVLAPPGCVKVGGCTSLLVWARVRHPHSASRVTQQSPTVRMGRSLS